MNSSRWTAKSRFRGYKDGHIKMTQLSPEIVARLKKAITNPCLTNSRALEGQLISEGYQRRVFGRFNQKSSIDAASESDRGITERLSNAFDASLTAARLLAGYTKSTREFTPRNAAQRFLNPNINDARWDPQDKNISFSRPEIQFWEEADDEKHRYRKYNPGDGLATVLISDFSLGISRERMPKTILELK